MCPVQTSPPGGFTMVSESCDNCADMLCPEHGKDSHCKYDMHATKFCDINPGEKRRLEAVREMRIARGKALCKSARVLIVHEDRVLQHHTSMFSEEDYLLIDAARHFIPMQSSKQIRPAVELSIVRGELRYRIIILKEGTA